MAQNMNRHSRRRRDFGRISSVLEMPNLIEVQRASYDQFLQHGLVEAQRTDDGLQGVFRSVFPIRDFSDRAELHFVRYTFEEPKYDVDECQQRGMTYAAPLKVTLQLWIFDVDEEIKKRDVRDIKEQDVYMGDMPLMTDKGTFIVNGTERVIVSQMHRSPGVFFDHDKGKTHSSGKYLFAARVIPYRGSWLDFEFDAKDIMHVRIDRRRKLPATSMLLALGLSVDEILSTFYETVTYTKNKKGWKVVFDTRRAFGTKLTADLVNAKDGKVVAKAGTKLTRIQLKKLEEAGLTKQLVQDEALYGRYLSEDVVDLDTGLIVAEAGDEINAELLGKLVEMGMEEVPTLDIDHVNVGPYIRNTLVVDKNSTREEALFDIYRVMRPGEPPTMDTAENLFRGLFFDSERYDLSAVGRVKMNARLGIEHDEGLRVLTRDDIIQCLKTLVELKDGKGDIDDIDHLGNRRVRSVGELLENQYRIGLVRMEKAIKERMSLSEIEALMPHDLINAKPVSAVVKEFFGSSQLSQFMDQTNPLSEITHKR
ncbi:MAG: DNA-directed RNA polymerase subunit beta, partial [Proteobacteria bacterium]|nr:DNA-directed RNA polymerase subunit beta [Pseudomonadota bacterium]